MPTLRRRGSTIAGRVGRRRVRRLRWSIELHSAVAPGALCFLIRVLPVAFRDRVRHRLTRGFPRGLKLGC
jgi:hypothetical protein